MKSQLVKNNVLSSVRRFSSYDKSFHKRTLPKSLISLSSPLGKQIFREALQLGGLESYFPLSEQFVTQSEPSFCSLSSLAMVLNALNFDPKKVWKGAWRWVSEETLQCETKSICGHSLERIRSEGLNFNEFESLARCHSVNIKSFRVNPTAVNSEIDLSPYNTFKTYVEKISSSDKANTFMVVNYSRGSLGQTGQGHFSPIGGYHSQRQLVLVLDVARFKYPPYWVPLDDLWKSMSLTDDHTGEARGYFVISGAHDATSPAGTTECKSKAQCIHPHHST
jgi:glutathione gamma-glutamylcysteinyltransferase